MTIKTAIRNVGPLSTRADVVAFDVAARTFEVTWSTGAAVLRSTWADGPFFEELSMSPASIRMGRMTSGTAPFLTDHDGSKVANQPGVIESARLAGGLGYATIRLAAAGIDPEVDKLFGKIADKIIRNVSVGYRVFKLDQVGDPKAEIPTFRAVDWEPYEVSAVSMGADSAAHFRTGADVLNPCSVPTNPRTSVRSPGARPMTPEEIAALELKKATEKAANLARSLELETAGAAAVKLDRERTAGITSAVRAAKLGDAFATKLIGGTLDLTGARAVVLEELAKRTDATQEKPSESVTGVEGGDVREKFARGMVSALLMQNVPALVRTAKEKNLPGFEHVDLDPGHMRGLSISDFARESLELKGTSTRGLDRNALASKAFTMTRDGGGPYAGVADFPVLLENAIGKILMGAYATTPDTWSRVCKSESVNDFRASPRYRAGSLGVLDALSENGEFKNKAIPDGAKLSISTATKGNIVAISRQLIVNDDMSALADLMTKLGRAARLSIEVDFYAMLALNGGLGPTVGANPFFHSSNGNVNAVASDITALGIDADRVVMASQRDAQSNELLDIRPEILLVPVGRGATARILNTSAINPDANGKIQQPNAVNGLFRDIVDTARLSGTRRYLFGSPDVAPAFVVAFLNGQQSPILESELGWRVDGTEMKVRFDYLVQAFDVKGALTNAGL